MPLSPVTRHGLFPVPPSPAVTRLHLPQEETKAEQTRTQREMVSGGGRGRLARTLAALLGAQASSPGLG